MLPVYASDSKVAHLRSGRRAPWPFFALLFLSLIVLGRHIHLIQPRVLAKIPVNAEAIQARCNNLKLKPGPSPNFHDRESSDRFVPGTKPVLIRNATIWTGRINGLEVIKGDILLDKGLIQTFGHVPIIDFTGMSSDIDIFDAKGAWVTPGIVDLHSHLGVNSAPALSGAGDGNSRHGITQPWLRALDGLNTHDDAYKLSISGGVTTALVLPGSANGIGGQGFVIKLRETSERSPTSMLLEPPFTLNRSSSIDLSEPPRWRQMKHACGENPRRVYGNTRMDNIWAFREVYDTARKIKEKQDAYCEKALNNEWTSLGDFPEELKWEALVDILRGRVKVQVHCYETVDLDDIVRLTNEFQFPIAAFHHAHETYLVPEVLKKAYGNVPASALFASNARYKRESYRGSEFAPRVLAENGLPVVMKSDHPVLNSRYLLYEAQQAHYYGLADNIALASVTTTPATVMGMDHRIGFIKEGYDADIAIWDSHPLALGATPKQVFIDGIPQFTVSHAVDKPLTFQKAPKTPNFDKEATDAVKFEGLQPLEPAESLHGVVVFTNVKSLTQRTNNDDDNRISETFMVNDTSDEAQLGMVVVDQGRIACSGLKASCSEFLDGPVEKVVDLKGGSIGPALISFGSALGLQEINGEISTQDGYVFDALEEGIPGLLGGDKTTALIHASDGLQFATRDAYLAYRSGVTTGITAPKSRGIISGLSGAFDLGAPHKLAKGAIVQEVVAVHVSVGHMGATPSISSQVAALRRLLQGEGVGEVGKWFAKVANGDATLVVRAESADVIATLAALKKEIEGETGKELKLTIAGGQEAHLLAKELAEANIGLILVPSRPFPKSWEKRRILPGPPLTTHSAISLLLTHNVTVGIGIEEPWSARNTRFDAAWAALEAPEDISRSQALALASSNLEKLLGLEVQAELADLVAMEAGDILDFESKSVGVISPRKGIVDLF